MHGRGIDVLVAVGAEDRRRAHDFRPPSPEKPTKEPKAEWIQSMKAKMGTEDSRARYGLRKQPSVLARARTSVRLLNNPQPILGGELAPRRRGITALLHYSCGNTLLERPTNVSTTSRRVDRGT